MRELKAIYTSQKSFYGKATIIENEEGVTLFSYNTKILTIKNGNITKHWFGYSRTTQNHINDFLQQEGFSKLTKKQWENL